MTDPARHPVRRVQASLTDRPDRRHPLTRALAMAGLVAWMAWGGAAETAVAAPPAGKDVVIDGCPDNAMDFGSGTGLMPHEAWSLDLWGGSLWNFGSRATPLDYTLVSALPSLRTPSHLRWPVAGGDLVVRARFGLCLQPIVEGPESYFFGAIGGPSLEWWSPAGRTALLLSAGGGVGLLDSRGGEVEGAQGQDFNLTWYAMTGIERRIGERWSLMGGVWYQHISNGGMSEPNPGIDAIGPMIGLGWSF